MHFEGNFEVAAARKDVYAFLTDPARLVTALPDVEEFHTEGPRSFTVKAKIGVSYIRGSVSLKFQIVDVKEDSYAKVVGRGSGIQSSIELTMAITMTDANNRGTRAAWVADASVGGLLAGVGNRLLGTVAEKYIKEITRSIESKLSTG